MSGMSTCWKLSLGVLVAAGTSGVAGENEKVTFRPCGIRVTADAYGEQGNLRPFFSFPGTSVSFFIESKNGGLIGFDDDKSKVVTFTDDKGTNLLTPGEFQQAGFNASPQISPDGKVALVNLEGATRPTRNARTVKAVGTFVVHTATKKTPYKAKDVSAVEGARIDAGPIPLTIKRAGKPDWGDDPFQVTLGATVDMTAVAAVNFYDGAGKPIESTEAGSMSMNFGGQVQIERSYNLKRKVDQLTVEVIHWSDLKTVEVPFNVEVGLGF